VGNRAREHDAVDAAGRRPRNDIDDDAQVEAAPANGLQRIEIDILGGRRAAVDLPGLKTCSARCFCAGAIAA